MPISSEAATYGERPSSLSFHGTMQTSRNIDPTKNVATRKITDCAARAIAFSGSWDSAARDGGDLGPHHREDDHDDAREDRADTVRQEAAVAGEVADVEALAWPQPDDEEGAEDQEGDDGEDLDAGEPVLELAVGSDGEQVRGRHPDHQPEGEDPEGGVEPEGEDLRAGDCLEPDDDHPEVPVE